MPGYKQHLHTAVHVWAIALVTITVFQALNGVGVFSLMQSLEWLGAAMAGALFPDVDVKSKGQQLFYSGLIMLSVLLLVFDYHHFLAWFLVLSLIPLILKHRGLTHEWWFLTLLTGGVCTLLYWAFPYYRLIIMYAALFFWLGAISHLWLDVHLPFNSQ